MQTIHQPVFILDDHPLVARGMAEYLSSIRPELTMLVASSFLELQRLVDQHGPPSLVLADVWLATGNVLEGMARFRSQHPDTLWLAISGDDDPSVVSRMRDAGAQGFVHKRAPPETLGLAVEALLCGKQWFLSPQGAQPAHPASHDWLVTPDDLGLTPRQGEILELVLRGLPNKRIGLMLSVSESTVKEHITGILERLGVRTRIEAITHLRGKRMHLITQTAAPTACGQNAGNGPTA